MALLSYSVLAVLLSRYIYAAITGDHRLETPYRSKSDDSFGQFSDENVEGEHMIQVPVYEAQVGVPLTIESLSLLNSNEYIQVVESCSTKSSIVGELLQFKRTSSMKSLGEVVSDDSTINWFASKIRPLSKTPSFNGLLVSLPITEAPTESNSTSGSSAQQQITIPNHLKQILESKPIIANISSFLGDDDIKNFSETNSLVQKYLNAYGVAVFKEILPSLEGLTDSIVVLRKLSRLLLEEDLKFNDWLDLNHPRTGPIIFLASFINHRLEVADKKPREIFALVDLIEFLRPSDFHDFFWTLPRPLQLFLSETSVGCLTLKVVKEKLLPVIMKAAHFGNLRVLKALKDDIMNNFGPELVLELFLLNSETREGISWTPFQRSIHNQNTKVSCFLFSTLTSNTRIIEAFHKILLKSVTAEESSLMPSFMEKIFFPCLARKKISNILKRRLLNAEAKRGIKTFHLAVTKAKISNIVKLFINWELQFNEPKNLDSFFSYALDLAFAAKSLIALRVIRRNFYDIYKIPIEMAIKSDWAEGLQEYSDIMFFKSYLLRYCNLFHLISRNNAVKVLEYLCTCVFSKEEIFTLTEQVDGHLKKPIDIALEAGNCEILLILQKFGAKINRKFLIKILKTNANFLDNFIPDKLGKEIFAHHFINFETSVTLLEWSIISGNIQAFDWFLKHVPLAYWKRFDGAGNTPIHLAVIVGNSEILSKLLNLDLSLLKIQNFFGETPISLAYRIREKTRSKDKQVVIDGIIELLAKYI